MYALYIYIYSLSLSSASSCCVVMYVPLFLLDPQLMFFLTGGYSHFNTSGEVDHSTSNACHQGS